MEGSVSSRRVAVVTGGNKGIGLEICRQLLMSNFTTTSNRASPDAGMMPEGSSQCELQQQLMTVVLTARSPERGLAAVARLLDQVHSSSSSSSKLLVFHPLDVRSPDSVSALASWLRENYGGLDILINNAAVAYPDKSSEDAKYILDTNYFGVKTMTKALQPIMRPFAHIINVSSSLGQLKFLDEPLRQEMADHTQLTEEKIDIFLDRFLQDVKAGQLDTSGWPKMYTPYSVSKVALNAYTRVLARELEENHSKIYVNCVHPGYVKTDLNNNQGPLSTTEGADTVVWLALLSPSSDLPHGQFFHQRHPLEF